MNFTLPLSVSDGYYLIVYYINVTVINLPPVGLGGIYSIQYPLLPFKDWFWFNSLGNMTDPEGSNVKFILTNPKDVYPLYSVGSTFWYNVVTLTDGSFQFQTSAQNCSMPNTTYLFKFNMTDGYYNTSVLIFVSIIHYPIMWDGTMNTQFLVKSGSSLTYTVPLNYTVLAHNWCVDISITNQPSFVTVNNKIVDANDKTKKTIVFSPEYF